MIETTASDITGDLGSIVDEMEEEVEEEMQQAVVEAEQIANRLVPVDTGQLRDSIEADTVNLEVVAGGKEAPYAIYVHEGMGPGEREPQPFLERAALEAFAAAAERLRNG